MYYNSNKQTDDYYNSYKREMQELEAYRKQSKLQQFMKILFFSIVLLLFGLATYYLYGYFNPNIQKSAYKIETISLEQIPSITITEKSLPVSPQLIAHQKEQMKHIQENATDTKKVSKVEQKPNISQEDIGLIVQIIMAQMNTKKKYSLEKQLKDVESTKFTQKKLKESNHYNKVILCNKQLKNNKSIQKDSLFELTKSINRILEEPVEDTISTPYSTSIQKEIGYRENEMRVIVVKKGDTLSAIAKRAYGSYNAYPKIFSANPEIIKNPNQIYEGMRLRIPS